MTDRNTAISVLKGIVEKNQKRMVHRIETEDTYATDDSRMEVGIEVGKLARELFGESVDVTETTNNQLDLPGMIERTQVEIEHETSVICEALLECFQWSDEEYDLQHIKEELADVMVYSQNLLDKLGLDADEIINMKMSQNEAKYPVDKAKGSAAKYDQL